MPTGNPSPCNKVEPKLACWSPVKDSPLMSQEELQLYLDYAEKTTGVSTKMGILIKQAEEFDTSLSFDELMIPYSKGKAAIPSGT